MNTNTADMMELGTRHRHLVLSTRSTAAGAAGTVAEEEEGCEQQALLGGGSGIGSGGGGGGGGEAGSGGAPCPRDGDTVDGEANDYLYPRPG